MVCAGSRDLVSFCSMQRNEAGPRNRYRQGRCSSIPRNSGGSSQFNSSVIIVNIFSSNTASLVTFKKVLRRISYDLSRLRRSRSAALRPKKAFSARQEVDL